MMTIRQIYDQYIYSRSTYCSAETIEKYSDDLRLFFRFLEHKYKISVDTAGFDALDQVSIYQDYLIYCRKRKIHLVPRRERGGFLFSHYSSSDSQLW